VTGRFLATAIIAGGSIIFAFVILLSYTNNMRKTLVNLSFFTLIPAGIAILLSFYSKDLLCNTVKALSPNFESVQPLLLTYIETRVPRLMPLIIGYLVIGLLLLWYSRKYKG
jgi:hypothetical protein